MEKTILKRWGIFILIYSICFIALFKTLKLTAPFLIALLVTSILYKPSLRLKNKFNVNSTLISILSVTILYLLIAGILTGLFAGLGYQIKEILVSIDTASFTEFFDAMGEKILSIYNGIDPNIIEIMTENWSKITSSLSTVAVNSLKGLLNISLATAKNIPYVLTTLAFAIISTFFMLKGALDGLYSNNFITKHKYFGLVITCKNMIFKYCGSFLMIIGMSFLQVLILLLICGVPNALLLSVLSALLDILPIVGMAVILIPLALYYLYIGAYVQGFAIIIGYLLVCLIRQLIEPKIMAKTLNISPLSSIMAIFIGLTAYGFVGMLFCIFFVVFVNVIKNQLNAPVIQSQVQSQQNQGGQTQQTTNP